MGAQNIVVRMISSQTEEVPVGVDSLQDLYAMMDINHFLFVLSHVIAGNQCVVRCASVLSSSV